jgi:outer membrane lipoprotein-sorting protein
MPALTSRTVLRWLVPVGVAVVVAAGVAGQALVADASPSLPPRSAAQLLVDLQTAKVDAFSGTVVQKADLGLPRLPNVATAGGTDLTSLATGTHTLRVWYGGPQQQRLALLQTLGESDVIHNGRHVWTWASATKDATHYRLPADADTAVDPSKISGAARTPPALTPQQAANQALATISPTTTVTTEGTATVAGRPAYELVLSPKDPTSKAAEVRVAIDAKERIPLRAQVYARGYQTPAYEVGFTHISFTRPGAEQFRFIPPPGTKVTERTDIAQADKDQGATAKAKAGQVEKEKAAAARGGAGKPSSASTSSGEPQLVGKGWTAVVVVKGLENQQPLGEVLSTVPRVSGSWGSGRLLSGKLFTMLLTDDGRLVAGAVEPQRLYQVASK